MGLVAEIFTRTEGQSEFNIIVNIIRSILNLQWNFHVKFIRRQENTVAQSFARAANSYASHHVHDYVPLCINSLVKFVSIKKNATLFSLKQLLR